MAVSEINPKFTDGMVITPKVEMTVAPSTKKRNVKPKDSSVDPLSDKKTRPYIGVAKKRNATKSEYYIDPVELAERVKEYYETEDDKGKNYQKLGEMFLLIAKKVATSSCFARYTFKDEFIGEAMIKMVKALRNKKFSFEFGSSPFSYYTQICYWSFCAVIKSEEKQASIARHYREVKYAESFKENEDTKNVYIRPESDGEIFKEYDYYANNSDSQSE